MSKNLPDMRQWRAAVEHLRRRGVSQPVSAERRNASAGASAVYDRCYQSGGQRRDWCSTLEEQCSAASPWSITTHMTGDGFPDIGRKWERVDLPPLAVHHEHALSPVEMVELKAGHLACTEAEPCEQNQNRVIPPANRSAPVTAREQQPRDSRVHTSRNATEPPSRHGRHGA